MEQKRITFYEGLIYTAYSYFILLGLAWTVMSYYWGGMISYGAIMFVALCAVQAWFKNKLANLILGIITLAASIFITLEFLLKGLKSGFNVFIGSMTALSVLGIILSGILIFSYTKLSFKDL